MQSNEETVDFVIENRSSRKSIDLPERSDVQTSPVKSSLNASASAPGKLKMRWLQATWQEESAESNNTCNQVNSASILCSNANYCEVYLLYV